MVWDDFVYGAPCLTNLYPSRATNPPPQFLSFPVLSLPTIPRYIEVKGAITDVFQCLSAEVA